MAEGINSKFLWLPGFVNNCFVACMFVRGIFPHCSGTFCVGFDVCFCLFGFFEGFVVGFLLFCLEFFIYFDFDFDCLSQK